MTTQLSLLDRDWITENVPLVVSRMRGRDFTADDLHAVLGEPPEPNWYGILCAKMRNSGLIVGVGYRPSTRPERNGGVLRVWRLK